MPFGRVGIGCDSLSSAALQIKSQEPSLRGKVYQPPVSPGGGTSSSLILSRSVLHSADAAFRTHLPRARCIARLFLSLRCSFLTSSLQSQTRQRKLLVSGLAIRCCGQFLRGRRHCPHSGRTSLRRTESALLRSLPRSHRSLPADSSCVADCLQSPLPNPLQTAPPPLRNSPCPGGRTLTLEALWPSAAIPPSCKRRKDRCTPLEPHPVRRLPRRTGLPARCFTPS